MNTPTQSKTCFFRLSCFASPTPCPPWSPWRRRATLRWSSQSIQEFNFHLQGASIDLPYSYSLLPGEPSHAFITILGIMLILPFIHLFFVLLYKLRCSLVKVRMEEKLKSNSGKIKPLQVMGKGDLIHGKGRKEGEGVEMLEAGQGLLNAN